jgi:hypothetical protein
MLGTMFTPDRNKARVYGFFLQLINGWAFSLLYVFVFETWGIANWRRGLVIGVLHGLFVLVVIMSMLPGLHPRMASEQHGPTANRELEPPGFMALNYGIGTPISVILAHAVCFSEGALVESNRLGCASSTKGLSEWAPSDSARSEAAISSIVPPKCTVAA